MGPMMLLNSNLELTDNQIETLQQSDPMQALSYETMQTILHITNQIIDKSR